MIVSSRITFIVIDSLLSRLKSKFSREARKDKERTHYLWSIDDFIMIYFTVWNTLTSGHVESVRILSGKALATL